MKASSARTFALLVGLLLAVACLRTQAQDPSAGSSGGASPQGEEVPAQAQTPQNDRTPVSGVEDYRLNGLNLGKSFILARIDFNENYDNNTNNSASKTTATNDSISNLHGSLALQFLSRRHALDLDYLASALFYARGTFSTSTAHQFNVTEKIYFRRLTLLLGDDFGFLPQSPLGLGGLGVGAGGIQGLPGLGGGLTNYNPSYVPGQTIQTQGDRISNAVVGQGQYVFGPRASANFSATYGLVHFFDAGLQSSRNLGLRFGYDHQIDPKQTITISTAYSRISFPSGAPGFFSQSIQGSYRRRISGRLSLIAGAGPQITHFTSVLQGSVNRISWTMQGTLRYNTVHNDLDFSYSHHITEGSGLLLGADTDSFNGQLSRVLTRTWRGSLMGQFNRNKSLRQTTIATASSQFNSWLGGVSFHRMMGTRATLDLRYTLSRQTSNVSVCAASLPCGSVSLRQQIGVGVSWNSRPYSLD